MWSWKSMLRKHLLFETFVFLALEIFVLKMASVNGQTTTTKAMSKLAVMKANKMQQMMQNMTMNGTQSMVKVKQPVLANTSMGLTTTKNGSVAAAGLTSTIAQSNATVPNLVGVSPVATLLPEQFTNDTVQGTVPDVVGTFDNSTNFGLLSTGSTLSLEQQAEHLSNQADPPSNDTDISNSTDIPIGDGTSGGLLEGRSLSSIESLASSKGNAEAIADAVAALTTAAGSILSQQSEGTLLSLEPDLSNTGILTDASGATLIGSSASLPPQGNASLDVDVASTASGSAEAGISSEVPGGCSLNDSLNSSLSPEAIQTLETGGLQDGTAGASDSSVSLSGSSSSLSPVESIAPRTCGATSGEEGTGGSQQPIDASVGSGINTGSIGDTANALDSTSTAEGTAGEATSGSTVSGAETLGAEVQQTEDCLSKQITFYGRNTTLKRSMQELAIVNKAVFGSLTADMVTVVMVQSSEGTKCIQLSANNLVWHGDNTTVPLNITSGNPCESKHLEQSNNTSAVTPPPGTVFLNMTCKDFTMSLEVGQVTGSSSSPAVSSDSRVDGTSGNGLQTTVDDASADSTPARWKARHSGSTTTTVAPAQNQNAGQNNETAQANASQSQQQMPQQDVSNSETYSSSSTAQQAQVTPSTTTTSPIASPIVKIDAYENLIGPIFGGSFAATVGVGLVYGIFQIFRKPAQPQQ